MKYWMEIAGAMIIAAAGIGLLLLIVPELVEVVKSEVRITKAPEYEWPECAPIDKTDPYWKLNNNMSRNGTFYYKVEYEPGKYRWEVDKEAMQALRDDENKKADLGRALETRVLSDEEMKQVLSLGPDLYVRNMQPYMEKDVRDHFYSAILQQEKLKAIGKQGDNK